MRNANLTTPENINQIMIVMMVTMMMMAMMTMMMIAMMVIMMMMMMIAMMMMMIMMTMTYVCYALQILFVDAVEGKQFDAALKSCLHKETQHVLSLLQQRVGVEPELRLYPVDPASITAYKLLQESPAWITSTEFAGMLQLKADMIHTWRSKKIEVERDAAPVDFTSVRVQQYSLIKSGKFGPDLIEDFTMPLPTGFPSDALLAKHALKPVLVEHEQLLSKLKVTGLPTSLEDVKVMRTIR